MGFIEEFEAIQVDQYQYKVWVGLIWGAAGA